MTSIQKLFEQTIQLKLAISWHFAFPCECLWNYKTIGFYHRNWSEPVSDA